MSTIEICLGVVVLFTSTCFGFSVGKNAGFKEGMVFYSTLLNNVTLMLDHEEGKED